MPRARCPPILLENTHDSSPTVRKVEPHHFRELVRTNVPRHPPQRWGDRMSAAIEFRHFAVRIDTTGGQEIRRLCSGHLAIAGMRPEEQYLVFAEVGNTGTIDRSGDIARDWYLTAAGRPYDIIQRTVLRAPGAHSGTTKLVRRYGDVTPERYISYYRRLLKRAAPYKAISIGHSLVVELPDEWNTKTPGSAFDRIRGAHPLTETSLVSSKLGPSTKRFGVNAAPALSVALDDSLDTQVILTWLCQAMFGDWRDVSSLRVNNSTADALYSVASRLAK